MGWSLAKGRWVLLTLALGGMAAVIALTTPNPTAFSRSLATFHFGYWLTVAGLLSSVLTEIGTHFTHRALLT
jgi:hypothetical protein